MDDPANLEARLLVVWKEAAERLQASGTPTRIIFGTLLTTGLTGLVETQGRREALQFLSQLAEMIVRNARDAAPADERPAPAAERSAPGSQRVVRTERGSLVADETELEFSPLGGHVTQDGIGIQVHIYRIVGGGDGWTLEVVDPTGTSIVWDEMFASDADAYRAFEAAMDEEGIRRFLPKPDETVH